RIAVAQSDSVAQRRILFPERFEINRHPERGADFVLAAITAANRPALVVKDVHVRTEKIDNLLCFRDQWLLVFQKREDRTLNWRDARVESQDNPRFHF